MAVKLTTGLLRVNWFLLLNLKADEPSGSLRLFESQTMKKIVLAHPSKSTT